ncbi:MAG: ATP-binding protein [Puniceicoccales bacterium]|jgi:hypothetical protein|nr:ATP-binding protein [Puniceicoccales bacterium]
MKPITSSSYTFSKLRETGTLYVDKTAFIHRLVTTQPKGIFFLARPRRFGKSLALSTFKSVFQGRRDLFKGLAIDSLEYEWKTHPVIHLDMTLCADTTAEKVRRRLLNTVNREAKTHGVEVSGDASDERFQSLIETLAERDGPVVILIDEYDRPVLENINDIPNAVEIRDELRKFYGVTKITESLQHFLFITGVASFAKVSFFSELNHVMQLSQHPAYATMFGYTQEELEKNFSEYIDLAASKRNVSRAEFLAEFKIWYNGYRFEGNAPTVYNPVSVAQFFEYGMKFQPFWVETGSSKILVEIARNQSLDFSEEISQPLRASTLNQFTVENVNVLPLLFQSGYFTIKESEEKMGKTYYRIGFPNFEVETSFEQNLLNLYLPGAREEKIDNCAERMHAALASRNYAAVISELNAQLAFIPGKLHEQSEAYYHSVAAMALRYSGAAVRIEEWVSTGIIDNTVTVGDLVYVFEFKIDKTAAAALAQIHRNNYAAKWRGTGKKIILFAIAFDTEKKCVSDYKVEEQLETGLVE